jgi:PAS domain S-box-containing protein
MKTHLALPETPSIDRTPPSLDRTPGPIYGTGEMADRVRAFDWSATPLGPIASWPETLLISVNILLSSRHPLLLWWGPDLIQFYNDAYRPSLGRGKHPKGLGQRGQECWQEVWDSIGPQIHSVLHEGSSTWNVDQYLPIYRNGDQLEDAWWTFSYSPIREPSGHIGGIFVVVSETTSRVLAERELHGNRERLQLALQAADLGTWSYDARTNLSTADTAMQRIFGSPQASGDFDYWITFVHPDDRSHVGAEFAAAIAGREPYESEYRIVRPDGQTRWIRSKGRIRHADDSPVRLVVIIEDITERKLAEMELRASTRDLRESQRIGKMGSWRLVLATNQLTWSEEVYRLMDHDPAMPVLNYSQQPEIIEPESGRRLQAAIDKCIATGRTYELDVKMFLPSGRTVWFATRGEAVLDSEGKVIELRGTVRDITDRKIAEEALRSSEERLQLALQSANLGTWSYDADTGISTGDPAMQRIFGSERPSGDFEYWIQFSHPEDREAIEADFLAALSTDAAYQTEYRIVRPTDGEVRWIRSVGRVLREQDRPLRMLVVVEDVTERKRTEAALLRNEKLAAVGRLASSIAHEINNPLESVTNLLYLARTAIDTAPNESQVAKYLDTAESELRRASAITSTTLRFHRQATRPAEISCDDLIGSVLGIHQSRMNNAAISVDRRTRSARPIFCSDGEIRQVLSNLIGNAIDAIQSPRQPTAGRLFVRSRETHDWPTGRPGVAITVADNGPGMTAPTAARIFEAFYTTKGDAGTGLGLWISKEIVDRHHGRLMVRSSQRPGRSGSVFTLFLPHQATTR